jgi:hypothetical protein
MDLHSENISVGFLVGIYFLASALVALTLVYISRPRPKIQPVKNETEQVKTNNLTKESRFSRRPTLPGSKHLFRNSLFIKKRSKIIKKEEPAVNPSSLSENNLASQEPSVIETEKNKTEELQLNEITLKDPKIQDKPDSSPDKSSVEEKMKNKENPVPETKDKDKVSSHPTEPSTSPPIIEETRLEKESAGSNTPNIVSNSQKETGLLPNSDNQKATTESVKGAQTEKEVNNETKPIPAVPLVKVVNEKQGKSEMNDKTKPENPNTDFSELFTQDTEETEASKLAKELSDIETEDILEESLSLISQFKKNKK